MGHWKNFDELEENLSLDELNATMEAMRDRDMRNMRFDASLQGIDLDKATGRDSGTAFDRVKAKAEAKLQEQYGDEVQEMTLADMGIRIETE